MYLLLNIKMFKTRPILKYILIPIICFFLIKYSLYLGNILWPKFIAYFSILGFCLFGFNWGDSLKELISAYKDREMMKMGDEINSDSPASRFREEFIKKYHLYMQASNPVAGQGSAGGNSINTQQASVDTSTNFKEGFMFDPITGQYRINDPTGVSDRPFDASGNNQPYATNMSKCLKHIASLKRWEDGKVADGHLNSKDHAYWHAFSESQTKPHVSYHTYWNSPNRRELLRKLP